MVAVQRFCTNVQDCFPRGLMFKNQSVVAVVGGMAITSYICFKSSVCQKMHAVSGTVDLAVVRGWWSSLKTVKIRPLQIAKEAIIYSGRNLGQETEHVTILNAVKAKKTAARHLLFIRGIQTDAYFILHYVHMLEILYILLLWGFAWSRMCALICVPMKMVRVTAQDATSSIMCVSSFRGGWVLPESADPQLCSRIYNWQGWADYRTTAERDGCHH